MHVQQQKTNMINEEWKKTKNDAPFVAFYDMRAVTFVLLDEMADVLIVGLQAISSLSTMFSKSCLLLMRQHKYLWSKGLIRDGNG